MERNISHEIEPKNPRPFHSLMDLPAVLEKVLIAHSIQLHPAPQSQKYVVGSD